MSKKRRNLNFRGYDPGIDEYSMYMHSTEYFFKKVYDEGRLKKYEEAFKAPVEVLKKVLIEMVDRQYDFFITLENIFMNNLSGSNVSGNLDQRIERYIEGLEKVFKVGSNHSLSKIYELGSLSQEFRRFMQTIQKDLKAVMKGKPSTMQNERDRRALKKIEYSLNTPIEEMLKIGSLIQELWEIAQNRFAQIGQKTTKEAEDEKKALEKIISSIEKSIPRVKKEGVSTADFVLNFFKDWEADMVKGEEFFRFIERITSHSTDKVFDSMGSINIALFIGLFNEPEVMRTLLNLNENLLESLIPNPEDMEQTGRLYQKNAVIDLSIFKQKMNGRDLKIGLSLKHTAKNTLNKSYAYRSLDEFLLKDYEIGGKRVPGFSSDLKNFFNWVKNNYFSLTSFKVRNGKPVTSFYIENNIFEIFARWKEIEMDLAQWVVLPRFFNQFLYELGLNNWKPFWQSGGNEDITYSIFVVNKDKVFRTSTMFKNASEILKGKDRSDTFRRENPKASRFSGNKEQFKQLYDAKVKAWGAVEGVFYDTMWGDNKGVNTSAVKDVKTMLLKLKNHGQKFRNKSLAGRIKFYADFEKLIK